VFPVEIIVSPVAIGRQSGVHLSSVGFKMRSGDAPLTDVETSEPAAVTVGRRVYCAGQDSSNSDMPRLTLFDRSS